MRCLLVAAALAAVSARAYAGNPLDKPAFSATPKELLDAAKAMKPSDRGARRLREDIEITLDAKGLLTSRHHLILAIDSEDEAKQWAVAWRSWRPWQQQHPQLRARTIAPSGQIHELEASALVDEPARNGELPYVRGPLTVDPGGIVEEDATIIDTSPAIGGRAFSAVIGGYLPVQRAHVTITAPVALKAKVVTHALPKTTVQHHTTSGGRDVWTFDLSDLAPTDEESDMAPDAYPGASIAVTTAHSWTEVARAAAGVIEPQLSGPLPPELHAGDSLDNARAVTAWLREHVRFRGADLTNAELRVNRDETLQRGTGGAAEVGLLLASLLRAANIPAEVVLVDRGPLHGVDRELPWLGSFDHVLVRATVAGKETWIDPEDPGLPIGQLRADDQGRPALALGAAALIDTPRAPASANAIHMVETYTAQEMGSSTLTIRDSSTGFIDADRRSWIRETGDAEIRTKWTDYARTHFSAHLDSFTHTAIDDLSHPVELTIAMSEAKRAIAHWGHLEVHVFPGDTIDNLPWELRDDKAKPRLTDYMLSEPQVCEIETRIVLPAGFAMPTPVAERQRQLGVASLVERQRVDGRTFIVTHHFEISKLRLAPAEVNATRTALLALYDEDESLRFEHEAWALVDSGKIAEGIQRMNAEIAANPRSGIAHARLAQLLLSAGAGDAARREGRKAVELAPKKADAYLAYAYVLTHDVVGNRWWRGLDIATARKQLETARTLSPKSAGVAFELASVLERGTNGQLFADGSDLKAAAVAWRAAYDLDPTRANATGLIRSLLWTGDAAGAEQIALKQPASTERETWLVAARTIKGNAAAAVRDVPAADRASIVAAAIGMTILVREYDAARALAAELGTTTIPGLHADVIAKLKRFDPKAAPAADPSSVAGELAIDEADPGSAGAIYWDKQTTDEVRTALRKIPLPSTIALVSKPLLLDMIHSAATTTVEGDANAWRVEMTVMGVRDIVYIAADRGVPKIIGTPEALDGVGRHLARLAGKHDDAVVRVLDWLVQDRVNRELMHIWGSAYPRDAAHINLAIAVIDDDPARKIAAGTACGMTTTDGQLVCDLTAAKGYRWLGKWAELEAFAAQWSARATGPAVVSAASEHADALANLGRLDEAERILDDALAKNPDMPSLLAGRLIVAAYRRQSDEVIKRADALAHVQSGSATALNNIAWSKYLLGIDLVNARELAQHAMELDDKAGYIANTVAALDVEAHDLKSAIANLRKAQTLDRRPAPSEGDWLVLGRIYETCGLRDDAIAAYRRITAPKHPDSLPNPHSIAAAHLKALGAPNK